MARGSHSVEIALGAALAAVVGFGLYAGRPRPPAAPPTQEAAEWAWLERTYGPGRHSTLAEEWIIRDFFSDKREGVFLDVGAGHHERYSNTFFLEKSLAWSGVAVDAQSEFETGYREHRPATRFVTAFVSDRSGDTAELTTSHEATEVASGSTRFTERWGAPAGVRKVPTTTLTDLLTRLGVAKIDFLNLDIELFEPVALAGFDIGRFRPALVCVEAHPEVRQQILDYFEDREYVLVGKYLRLDRRNLYFMPRGWRVQPFPDEVTREWTYHPRESDAH